MRRASRHPANCSLPSSVTRYAPADVEHGCDRREPRDVRRDVAAELHLEPAIAVAAITAASETGKPSSGSVAGSTSSSVSGSAMPTVWRASIDVGAASVARNASKSNVREIRREVGRKSRQIEPERRAESTRRASGTTHRGSRGRQGLRRRRSSSGVEACARAEVQQRAIVERRVAERGSRRRVRAVGRGGQRERATQIVDVLARWTARAICRTTSESSVPRPCPAPRGRRSHESMRARRPAVPPSPWPHRSETAAAASTGRS